MLHKERSRSIHPLRMDDSDSCLQLGVCLIHVAPISPMQKHSPRRALLSAASLSLVNSLTPLQARQQKSGIAPCRSLKLLCLAARLVSLERAYSPLCCQGLCTRHEPFRDGLLENPSRYTFVLCRVSRSARPFSYRCQLVWFTSVNTYNHSKWLRPSTVPAVLVSKVQAPAKKRPNLLQTYSLALWLPLVHPLVHRANRCLLEPRFRCNFAVPCACFHLTFCHAPRFDCGLPQSEAQLMHTV